MNKTAERTITIATVTAIVKTIAIVIITIVSDNNNSNRNNVTIYKETLVFYDHVLKLKMA